MNCEILAPAGNEASARAAISGGADAIYLGLTRFSAREGAENFSFDSLRDLVRYAKLLNVKVYVCLNTLVKESETDDFFSAVRSAWEAGADALLIQDLFLGKAIKEAFPEIVLHLSTQAGCCNERGARLAKEFGFSRVVLARETPIGEIGAISKIIETEVFVQGALCSCFSGQCYLSSFAGNNSGNRGRCKQPCRKRYRIDRAGYEAFAYALSPSDLNMGRRIGELIDAGVSSFKIEGRLRRPEYVYSAVSYYRALLGGGEGSGELRDLKRAFNRGDYTEGLAFGQGKDFLSRKVQGHIGEAVGTMRDSSFCESGYPARPGDGFKILRGGKEAGGALFRASGAGGFYLSSPDKLRRGDEVRLTTDSSLAERAGGEKRREIVLSLSFRAGEKCRIVSGDFLYEGETAEEARSAPLNQEELKECFRKTDGLPFAVSFGEVAAENAFLPKSRLNALRRDFFGQLAARLAPARPALDARRIDEEPLAAAETRKVAVIATSLKGLAADILIYKPADYARIDRAAAGEGTGERYLYLPPFFTREDEEAVLPHLSLFDGIYSDGYYGLEFARAHRMAFFAGTGFNLTNRFAVAGVRRAGAKYFALSKELTGGEQRALSAEGAFALTLGSVKVMDLVYCPFERTCGACDRRPMYRAEDEEGRRFPLRRYRAGESCRFELYNCAPIAAYNGRTGALVDLTAEGDDLTPFAFAPEKAGLKNATRGHFARSLL